MVKTISHMVLYQYLCELYSSQRHSIKTVAALGTYKDDTSLNNYCTESATELSP